MKKLAAGLVALAAVAPSALASATGTIKVSRRSVKVLAGTGGVHLRVSGRVKSGCRVGHKGDVVTVYSNAFDRTAAKQTVGGIPSVDTPVDTHGKFSVRVLARSSQPTTKKTYNVSGRCGGGTFATTPLTVNYQPYG